MNAEVAIPVENEAGWRERLLSWARRAGLFVWLEILFVALLATTILVSYLIIGHRSAAETLVTPGLGAALLVANLVPAMALMVLFARRLAIRRALRDARWIRLVLTSSRSRSAMADCTI